MEFSKMLIKLDKLTSKLGGLGWSVKKEEILDKITHLEEDIITSMTSDQYTQEIVGRYAKKEYSEIYKAAKKLIENERENTEIMQNIE